MSSCLTCGGSHRSGPGCCGVAQAIARQRPELVRALDQRIGVPTTVLWPSHDPLFPRAWSDRIGEFFAAATLTSLDGVGHFVPLERPETFAAAVTAAAGGSPS
jgi:pimeloyl-ACP methyl ester carboxylesterase